MINPSHFIEQTCLKPDITHYDIEKLVLEAKEYGFKGICVPPFWVKKSSRDLEKNENISLVTVVGFPLGYQMTEVKMKEADMAINDGATEIDLVWNISAFKAEMIWPKIEIAKMAKLCHEQSVLLKVIIETSFLSKQEIIDACKICADGGADFVKTSTGFSSLGAQSEDIQLMSQYLPAHVGIKASGGIKTLSQLEAMIESGADRVGTSSGVGIMKEFGQQGG